MSLPVPDSAPYAPYGAGDSRGIASVKTIPIQAAATAGNRKREVKRVE